MCNQFTLHHEFRVGSRKTKLEQRTDGILHVCRSYGQRTQGSWHDRLGSTASCTIHADNVEETSKHGVLGRFSACSTKRIEVVSDTIKRHHPLQYTPSLLYPEGYKDGNWSHLGRLRRFPWDMIGWRNWVQKLLDKQKVPNQPNQTQIQITIDRGDPLFAHKERLIHVSLVEVRTQF